MLPVGFVEKALLCNKLENILKQLLDSAPWFISILGSLAFLSGLIYSINIKKDYIFSQSLPLIPYSPTYWLSQAMFDTNLFFRHTTNLEIQCTSNPSFKTGCFKTNRDKRMGWDQVWLYSGTDWSSHLRQQVPGHSRKERMFAAQPALSVKEAILFVTQKNNSTTSPFGFWMR